MRIHYIVVPLIIILPWIGITVLGLVNPILLPAPWNVFREITRLLLSGELGADIVATLYRVALGFLLGLFIGVPAGLVIGYYPKGHQAFDFPIDFARSIPVTALLPLFLLIWGIGEQSKILIAAWSSSLIILINTVYGVRNSTKTRLFVARTMKASPWQIFTKVICFEALPHVTAGARTALSLAVIVIVVMEMLLGGATTGLGQRILNTSLLYRIPEMYGTIIVTGVVGYGLNRLFVSVEQRVVFWTGK